MRMMRRKSQEPHDAPAEERLQQRGRLAGHEVTTDRPNTSKQNQAPAVMFGWEYLARSALATGNIPPAARPMRKHITMFQQNVGIAPQIEVPTNKTAASRIAARRP
jgi:hypothetical protein